MFGLKSIVKILSFGRMRIRPAIWLSEMHSSLQCKWKQKKNLQQSFLAFKRNSWPSNDQLLILLCFHRYQESVTSQWYVFPRSRVGNTFLLRVCVRENTCRCDVTLWDRKGFPNLAFPRIPRIYVKSLIPRMSFKTLNFVKTYSKESHF